MKKINYSATNGHEWTQMKMKFCTKTYRTKSLDCSEQQVPITVYFEEEVVGNYYADILVEDKVILEIKSVENIIDAHIAQTLNYLKATGLRLAIILNFSKEKLEYKRIVK